MKQEIENLPGPRADFIWGYRLTDLTNEELIRIISWQAYEAAQLREKHFMPALP